MTSEKEEYNEKLEKLISDRCWSDIDFRHAKHEENKHRSKCCREFAYGSMFAHRKYVKGFVK